MSTIPILQSQTLTFVGAGHMGGAIIGGLIRAGQKPEKIWAVEPNVENLQRLAGQYGIHTGTDNAVGVAQADVVIFAVKPQMIDAVLPELQPVLQHKKPLVLSVIAGTSEAVLQNKLGGGLSIVRTMPNTPALMGYGATVLYANAQVSTAQKQIAAAIFNAVGQTFWLEDESLMDTVTALSGTGPAYFFMLAESLQEAAIAAGLPPELAAALTAQTALGSAHMLLNTEHSAAQLRKQVTSPGGGTEQAVKVLEAEDFKAIVGRALQAAKQRYEEMMK